jgi:phosphatidylglycerol:prolipoprotein diacylglycerol transferase
MVFLFPDIDPIALKLGPLMIRWYALAYLSGLLLGWRYIKRLVRYSPYALSSVQVDDLLFYVTLGVILGGRIGYILFYNLGHYLSNPFDILAVWHGGMSFHGGVLGVVFASFLFSKKYKIRWLAVGDVICCAEPIGQFFGRIANFINGELIGRPVSDTAPWGMIFPHIDHQIRHPSQLYEAGLEGALLFLIMFGLWRRESLRNRPGFLSGVFFIGYGLSRIMVENFREPDSQIGYLMGGMTLGQVLSYPLMMVGGVLIMLSHRLHKKTSP